MNPNLLATGFGGRSLPMGSKGGSPWCFFQWRTDVRVILPRAGRFSV